MNITFNIKREDNDFKLNQIIIGSSAENRHWEKDYSEKEDMYDNLIIFMDSIN